LQIFFMHLIRTIKRMSNVHHRLERIEVRGIVQGVGFRPFIYNLAHNHRLYGYVRNSPDGVLIEAEGNGKNIEAFISDLQNHAPRLSRIVEIQRTILDSGKGSQKYKTFDILTSEQNGQPVTLISPDVCTCDDCLEELFDPENRRYLYPFINCTNCGPRFTIIRHLPYDRPFTTMADFSLCAECGDEYYNPSNRRFHAQPNACSVCGPELELLDGAGKQIAGDPILESIKLLQDGRIVAVKGLGGFHLAVDAANEKAVERLRMRKQREEKPLALMVGNMETAHILVNLTEVEEHILKGLERPIFVACRREDVPESFQVADSIAPYSPYLGIMLPYTPIHYLLFFHPLAGGDFARSKTVFNSLVMTSCNMSEEPVCKDNDETFQRISGVADAFLIHNRDIHVRCDDSVVTVNGAEISFIRRSRGFAPMPVFLPEPVPQVLAFGAELKNILCITDDQHAFVSQHIGDLENIPTLNFFKEAVAHFKEVLNLNPRIFAYDLHPEYLSTKYCMELMDELGEESFSAVGVQHHHAHIASVLAEHGHTGPVIGFSMDGTGYGTDGTLWGGEVLVCTPTTFERFAHLEYIPLPGGSAAIREPWRMAFSYLRTAWGDDWMSLPLPCMQNASHNELKLLDQACASNVNCPSVSSLGRLFDAVASILDIRHVSAFEGQAAIMLEASAAKQKTDISFPYTIRRSDKKMFEEYPVVRGNISGAVTPGKSGIKECFVLDYAPLIRNIAEEFIRGMPRQKLAYAFHNTLIESFLEMAERARESTGIKTVALSGGCWQNRILTERFSKRLKKHDFVVLINRQVPVNDGGISLGQAFVAANVIKKKYDWS